MTNTEQVDKESHETVEDYCCACEYDIACFETRLKEVHTEAMKGSKKEVKEKFTKCIRLMRKAHDFTPDDECLVSIIVAYMANVWD